MLLCIPNVLRSRASLVKSIGHSFFSCSTIIPTEPKTSKNNRVKYPSTRTTSLGFHRCGQYVCCGTIKLSPLTGVDPAAENEFSIVPPSGHAKTPDRSCVLLQRFLSCCIAPVHTTPADVLALYEGARFCVERHRMDLSSLISFFGTLSMPAKDHSRFSSFTSDLALPLVHGQGHGCQAYWRVVLQLIEDKERLRQSLTMNDHFWAMQAELASLRSPSYRESSKFVPHKKRIIACARQHYLALCGRPATDDLHESYLDGLQSFRTLAAMFEFVERLSSLIRTEGRCSVQLVQLLWRAVLTPHFVLPRKLRETLLSAIRDRVMRLHRALSQRESIGIADQRTQSNPFTVTDLGKALRTSIFLLDPKQSSALNRWAIAQASNAFEISLPAAVRWRYLTLLALIDVPSSLSNGSMDAITQISQNPEERLASWQTVCVLSALQAIQNPASSSVTEPELAEKLKSVVRSTWRQWKAGKDDPPTSVTQAIVTSFLYLAGRTRDKDLKDACHQLCLSRNLWSVVGTPQCSRQQTQELAAEFILSSIACDGDNWQQIFSAVIVHITYPYLARVTSIALMRLIQRNKVLTAHSLYAFTRHQGLQLSKTVVHALASRLASAGHLELAFQFFADEFPRIQRRRLLAVILRHLMLSRERDIDPRIASVISKVMLELFTDSAPPSHLRRFIEYVIPVIAVAKHPFAATSLVKSISAIHPTYVRMPCLSSLLRVLLDKRQFRNALALYRVVAKHPSVGLTDLAEFRRSMLVAFSKSQASNLGLRASRISVSPFIPRYRTLALARAQAYRKCGPDRFLALRVIPIVSRSLSDPHLIHFALCVLVRAGRLSAAQRLFGRTYANFTTQWQTSMCNAILHGVLLKRSSRNRQRIKDLLKTMAFYINKRGFTPDRVTINILLKAMIQWKTGQDNEKLRRLFDHVIRTAYSLTVAGKGDGAPFNTTISAVPPMPLPRLPPFVSFKRHVRPMYKQFIKGLYVRGDVLGARTLVALLREETIVARER